MPLHDNEGDEDAHAHQQFINELDILQKRILKVPGVREDLARLSRAHIDSSGVLRTIALMAKPTNNLWKDMVRERRKELLQLSDDLSRIALLAERLSTDPFSSVRVWLALMDRMDGKELHHHETAGKPSVLERDLIRKLRKYAEVNRARADLLGKFLKNQTKLDRGWPLFTLLQLVHRSSRKNHDDVLARLLTDAHEVMGRKKRFSADQLKKFRQRRLKPTLERIRLNETLDALGLGL
jgi:hypothetical protein